MINALIGLAVLIIVIGIVYYILTLLLQIIPMDERFKHVAIVIVLLICSLIVLAKVLPLIGVNSPI